VLLSRGGALAMTKPADARSQKDPDDSEEPDEDPESKEPPDPFVRNLKRIGAAIAALAVIVGGIGVLWKNFLQDLVIIGGSGVAGTPSAAAKPPSTTADARETVDVPFYGTLTVGGPCNTGQHVLQRTWNCDANRKKRVHCQNGMVTVDSCPKRCIQHEGGIDDECE
jgi:hypothetical protein